jgi:hypothetical protein
LRTGFRPATSWCSPPRCAICIVRIRDVSSRTFATSCPALGTQSSLDASAIG